MKKKITENNIHDVIIGSCKESKLFYKILRIRVWTVTILWLSGDRKNEVREYLRPSIVNDYIILSRDIEL